LASLTTVVGVAFSGYCFLLWPGNTVTQSLPVYQSLYTPSDYTLIVWGVIAFSLIVYTIIHLMPSQSEEPIYDDVARPLVLANLFLMGWAATFALKAVALSTALICCTLACALLIYARVRDSVLRDDSSNWLSFPFSLLAGWLSVVTIDSGALLLIACDVTETISSQLIMTSVMILATGILGIGVCFRCRDFVFPFVISWALVGIFVGRRTDYPFIAVLALVGAAMPAVWITTALIRRISYRHRTWANKLSF
jgi:hypothetical protein